VGACSYFLAAYCVDHLLRSEAERTAEEWAHHLVTRLPNLEAIADGQALSPGDVEVVQALQAVGSVFRFKLFGKHGNIRLASDDRSTFAEKTASVANHSPVAARVLSVGRPFVDTRSGAGNVDRPLRYSQAYAPIVKAGTAVAVVEVYVDQAARYMKYRANAAGASAILAFVAIVAFAMPALAFYLRSRKAEHLKDSLERRYEQVDTALDNMPQGLAVFDAEHRLVVCNKQYGKLYGLTPEQTKPGTSIRQLLRYGHAKGFFGNVDFEIFARDWLVELKQPSSRVHELSDGRVLSIACRPKPDGGLVATTEDITERRRMEERIQYLAHHDALTGLANRVRLRERLDQALAGRRGAEGVAVLCLDLDQFKQINDTLGHPVGDALLKAVAQRLQRCARSMDTVARASGDEFVVVLPSTEPPQAATALAARIIDQLSAPYELVGHQVVIGTSIGIALSRRDCTDAAALLKQADVALYRAKEEGRGRYRFFEEQMDQRMQTRLTMERDLRKALTAGEFELYYQPVVNLERNELAGVEALIRWHHAERGMVSPVEFIPLAEETGLIVQIGDWAIRQACATAAAWPDHLVMAVNVSAAQFRRPGLVQAVVSALASSGLAPERLELEITETALLASSEATLATLYELRKLGVRIAMDDFGTGYSSLGYLQKFPFDRIKIDRSFIKEVVASAGALNIVRAVTALAHGLGMATTAEGVETQEQLDSIKSEGCTEMQGFLFSRPRPRSEIEQLFLAERTQANATVAA
jgi:diguanylate cyclase (GGDEF)-like protein